MTSEIELKRIELESKEKEAHSTYKKSEHNWKNICHQLESLQEECKHKHAVIKHGYQGGGNYYCKCSCSECGRSGYRYIPQYHLHLHNEWYEKHPEHQITLEEAIEKGKRMGKGLLYNHFWWGVVEDYDKLVKDTSEGWV